MFYYCHSVFQFVTAVTCAIFHNHLISNILMEKEMFAAIMCSCLYLRANVQCIHNDRSTGLALYI